MAPSPSLPSSSSSSAAERDEEEKGKIRSLVEQARTLLESSNSDDNNNNDDDESLWQAYVAIERAILAVKLRHPELEGEKLPPAPKRTAKREDLIAAAKAAMLQLTAVDAYGKTEETLYLLRTCRDALKAAVAKSS